MKRVVVGLSGGVDSTVAAYLLKKEGYDVIGIFMKNWHDSTYTLENECPWIQDSNDALIVANSLDIPYMVKDLSKEYKERIVDYMFSEYEKGRTPNPDVLCNREIKFDIFLEVALKLGADYVATGHYARKYFDGTNYKLLKGLDPSKDQSYFLCQLNQYQLSKALFPIGHLNKSQIRKIATDKGFITADKKDSQGLCFIGHVNLPDFLSQELKPKKGHVIDIDNNKILGEHKGAHYYTIGQRKGLGISGNGIPYYVCEINTKTNKVFVAQGNNNKALYSSGFIISDPHWVNPQYKVNNNSIDVTTQIRYHGKFYNSNIRLHDNELHVLTNDEKFYTVAPGQFAAIYIKDELIISGIIEKKIN